ncbi:MAG: helix-turn-helix domain-containing protein, partial [Nitrospirae bacterium]|nr:helix-turn-helix domain-containing protein [Nitrospirota bacterium]
LHQRIEELSLKSPRAKIASYIALLAETQDSSFITLPAYQRSIATFLNMTQETFYRTIKKLEDDGIMRVNGQQIEIINNFLLKEFIE